MKRIIAIVSLLAVVLSFAACKANDPTQDPQEALSNQNAVQAEMASASILAETKIAEKMDEVQSELGKTQKNKQIVYNRKDGNVELKYIVTFNKKNVADEVIVHKFYDYESTYETVLGYGDYKDLKIIDNDDELRYIVYKYKEHSFIGQDFEYVYNAVSSADQITVIE